MPAQLDIKMLIAQGKALQGEEVLDFSGRDFSGFCVPQPVCAAWRAAPLGEEVRLDISVNGQIEGQCVRCLQSFCAPFATEACYDITPEELVGEYPEYPTARDGVLDLEEMAYGEIVLNGPIVPVCREDCEGLCSVCGGPKGACSCADAPTPEADMDPRWAALRGLLQEE